MDEIWIKETNRNQKNKMQLAKEIAEANTELEAGLLQPKTVEEIMKMVEDEE